MLFQPPNLTPLHFLSSHFFVQAQPCFFDVHRSKAMEIPTAGKKHAKQIPPFCLVTCEKNRKNQPSTLSGTYGNPDYRWKRTLYLLSELDFRQKSTAGWTRRSTGPVQPTVRMFSPSDNPGNGKNTFFVQQPGS
ncbi:MAG: hypothetical protein CSA26_08715 [Desulfobacterales bacterium]|nr:MAG: hypothetical protein CSA26_08715 [Desulfobacterales bacterium]